MIVENIANIKKDITTAALRANRNPEDIRLVAVSKRFPVEKLQVAINGGQTLFGENYIQEVQEKKEALGETAQIHFIGNLQSNKARLAAQNCSMVETVDRYKIAKALNKHMVEFDRNLDILIQVNIGDDDNKSGTSKEDVIELIEQVKTLSHLNIRGLMTIPPFNDNPEETRIHFSNLRHLRDELQEKAILTKEESKELSMGMSGDFLIAIEEGATIVRVGTAIFGSRPY